MNDSRWDVLSTIEGAIAGFFTAVVTVFGWFNSKLKNMNTLIDALAAQTTENKANIMVQEAHHQANIQRLDRIERETMKQTDMLTQLLRENGK